VVAREDATGDLVSCRPARACRVCLVVVCQTLETSPSDLFDKGVKRAVFALESLLGQITLDVRYWSMSS
jgi:hypothetical protein